MRSIGSIKSAVCMSCFLRDRFHDRNCCALPDMLSIGKFFEDVKAEMIRLFCFGRFRGESGPVCASAGWKFWSWAPPISDRYGTPCSLDWMRIRSPNSKWINPNGPLAIPFAKQMNGTLNALYTTYSGLFVTFAPQPKNIFELQIRVLSGRFRGSLRVTDWRDSTSRDISSRLGDASLYIARN